MEYFPADNPIFSVHREKDTHLRGLSLSSKSD